MSGPLLSRFDLIFVLLDSSDENRDRHLSEHVMALHSGAGVKICRFWGIVVDFQRYNITPLLVSGQFVLGGRLWSKILHCLQPLASYVSIYT